MTAHRIAGRIGGRNIMKRFTVEKWVGAVDGPNDEQIDQFEVIYQGADRAEAEAALKSNPGAEISEQEVQSREEAGW